MKNQIIYLCGDWKMKNNQNMFPQKLNRTGGVMERVVVLGVVDGTFNPWSCQNKD
jgi:hypothetical protein